MGNEIALRPARIGDARAIAEARWFGEEAVLNETFPDGFPSEFIAADIDALEEHFREQVVAHVSLFVAEMEDTVVGAGFAGSSSEEPATGCIEMLYVLPVAWGKGVGSLLHARLIQMLQADGFTDARMWVMTWNLRARRFYERQGWGVADERMTTPNGLELIGYRRRL